MAIVRRWMKLGGTIGKWSIIKIFGFLPFWKIFKVEISTYSSLRMNIFFPKIFSLIQVVPALCTFVMFLPLPDWDFTRKYKFFGFSEFIFCRNYRASFLHSFTTEFLKNSSLYLHTWDSARSLIVLYTNARNPKVLPSMLHSLLIGKISSFHINCVFNLMIFKKIVSFCLL